MRLIVNADDLGSSRKVNDAIFGLMASGTVRSASILANGRVFDDVMARTMQFPACSFGVHLNVTDGAPVEATDSLAPILDSQGRFREGAIRNVAMRPVMQRAVFHEWSRQIERVMLAGTTVSHLDSHHHVHTNPWLLHVLKKVQRKFGIRRVRIARSRPDVRRHENLVSRIQRRVWTGLVQSDGTKTSDFLFSLADYRQCAARLSPACAVELMVHPGLDAYDDETSLLQSDWWKDQMRANHLIGYNEL